jgi:hypothetical protein
LSRHVEVGIVQQHLSTLTDELERNLLHGSITVTAHTYADLFDDELDNIAVALDSLSDF